MEPQTARPVPRHLKFFCTRQAAGLKIAAGIFFRTVRLHVGPRKNPALAAKNGRGFILFNNVKVPVRFACRSSVVDF
jgi:hypothetical protein